MTLVITVMSVVLALAVLALAVVAYAARGDRLPGGEWLGDVLDRAAHAVPILADGDLDPRVDEAVGTGTEPAPAADPRPAAPVAPTR